MNIVVIVPTGVGAEIGGHAGDANPVAKLFGALCDNLITHPNVVNGSDVNEMPENTWYVEGSLLDRFLEGRFRLARPRTPNRILVAVNPPVNPKVVNAVSAARATIGASVSILQLETPLQMTGGIGPDGKPIASHSGVLQLVSQVTDHHFDALAIATPIDVPIDTKLNYFKNGGVNPWGYVEAQVSHIIADGLDKPVAHAPQEDELADYNEVVDPRMSAEMVSIAYLHCVLKGLHRAPRVVTEGGLGVADMDVMVAPDVGHGRVHAACTAARIPILVVAENKTIDSGDYWHGGIRVANYHEAAGWVACMKAGIDPASVRRPLVATTIT